MRKRLVLQVHYDICLPGLLRSAQGTHILGTLLNVHLLHSNCTWHFKCSAAEWARQINLSHVVTLPNCDTPIVNTLIHTLLSLYARNMLCFLHDLLLTNLLEMFWLLRRHYSLFYYNLYFFISKHL